MGLEDDLIALDFDMACAYRFDLYERDGRKQQAYFTIERLAEAMDGGGSSVD